MKNKIGVRIRFKRFSENHKAIFFTDHRVTAVPFSSSYSQFRPPDTTQPDDGVASRRCRAV